MHAYCGSWMVRTLEILRERERLVRTWSRSGHSWLSFGKLKQSLQFQFGGYCFSYFYQWRRKVKREKTCRNENENENENESKIAIAMPSRTSRTEARFPSQFPLFVVRFFPITDQLRHFIDWDLLLGRWINNETLFQDRMSLHWPILSFSSSSCCFFDQSSSSSSCSFSENSFPVLHW